MRCAHCHGTVAMALGLVQWGPAGLERRIKNVEGTSEVFLAMSGSAQDGWSLPRQTLEAVRGAVRGG